MDCGIFINFRDRKWIIYSVAGVVVVISILSKFIALAVSLFVASVRGSKSNKTPGPISPMAVMIITAAVKIFFVRLENICYIIRKFAGSFNGRTADFESVNLGTNPSPAAVNPFHHKTERGK